MAVPVETLTRTCDDSIPEGLHCGSRSKAPQRDAVLVLYGVSYTVDNSLAASLAFKSMLTIVSML